MDIGMEHDETPKAAEKKWTCGELADLSGKAASCTSIGFNVVETVSVEGKTVPAVLQCTSCDHVHALGVGNEGD